MCAHASNHLNSSQTSGNMNEWIKFKNFMLTESRQTLVSHKNESNIIPNLKKKTEVAILSVLETIYAVIAAKADRYLIQWRWRQMITIVNDDRREKKKSRLLGILDISHQSLRSTNRKQIKVLIGNEVANPLFFNSSNTHLWLNIVSSLIDSINFHWWISTDIERS